ncbi:hypothetical protein BGZ99_000536 [Dissophora globulifera]|uniref:Uncharacterized protein n=1 Tax=Dissophora globulifera TaxID=979702 RepID=A0A9P6UY91_9FUNG|nr:hypothetical protein BGZ99_000536 [Dissophora globulifera]
MASSPTPPRAEEREARTPSAVLEQQTDHTTLIQQTQDAPLQQSHPPATSSDSLAGTDPSPVDPVIENVRNFKRKVISSSKFLQMFNAKNSETDALVSKLGDAQSQIAALQKQIDDFQAMKESLSAATLQLKQAQTESVQAKSKQQAAEDSLAIQTQKVKGLEMLKSQLEAKSSGQEKARDEINILNRKLNNAHKELEQSRNKGKQEIADLREKLTKANADLAEKAKCDRADKTSWLADQKRIWQKEEEQRHQTTNHTLLAKVEELEQQLEDVSTERYLEVEIANEEKKNTEQSLLVARSELVLITNQNRELRAKNLALERRLKARGDGVIPTQEYVVSEESVLFEEYEDPDEIALTSSHHTPTSTSRPWPSVSPDQLDRTLQSIDELKSQLNILRIFSGQGDEKQGMTALVDQVNTLTKEKQALQDQLTRHIMDDNARPIQSRKVQPDPIDQPTSTPAISTAVSAPEAPDTSAPPAVPKKRGPGRPPKNRSLDAVAGATLATSSVNSKGKALPSASLSPDITDISGITSKTNFAPTPDVSNSTVTPASAATVVGAKRGRKRKVDILAAAGTASPESAVKEKVSTPKRLKTSAQQSSLLQRMRRLAKSSGIKRSANTMDVDLTHIEIRNISLNPVIPSTSNPFQYFTFLMSSTILQDSQAEVKLDMVAQILPAKLEDLFEAVRAEARDIVPKVAAFRKQESFQDGAETWSLLQGGGTIEISSSLSRAEANMVQFLVVLQAYFPQMSIYNLFFVKMYNTILHDAASDASLDITCILTRVLIGVCMTLEDLDRARILVFDLLREIPKPTTTLVLCEAVASIWPAVFITDKSNLQPQDPRVFMTTAFQAIIANCQETVKNDIEVVPYGYDTFVERCKYPALDQAPYIDEVVTDMVALIRTPEFLEMCRSKRGYRFTFGKALELLFVQGYEWNEFYNGYLRTELYPLMLDSERYAIVTPLVAAISQEARNGSAEAAALRASPIRQVLEKVLVADDAAMTHKVESALAIAMMSNGDAARLENVRKWYRDLTEEVPPLPVCLQRILA